MWVYLINEDKLTHDMSKDSVQHTMCGKYIIDKVRCGSDGVYYTVDDSCPICFKDLHDYIRRNK